MFNRSMSECNGWRKLRHIQKAPIARYFFGERRRAAIAILPFDRSVSIAGIEIVQKKKIEKTVDPKNLSAEELEIAMRALPPQARIALETMAQMQNRPAEDVLRDEIRQYIAGRLPIVNIDAAIEAIQATAHTAGYLIGRLRRFAREMNNE